MTADNAVDGDISTKSVTRDTDMSWWMAQFTTSVRLTSLDLFLNKYSLAHAQYSQLKVEVKLFQTDQWRVCKQRDVIGDVISPYKVVCDVTLVVRYVRVSVAGGRNLMLHEVEGEGMNLEVRHDIVSLHFVTPGEG